MAKINSLEDAIKETLLSQNVNLNDDDEVKRDVIMVVNDLVNNNFNCITRQEGARDFVRQYLSNHDLISTLQKLSSQPYLNLNELIPAYADGFIASLKDEKDLDKVDKKDETNITDDDRVYEDIQNLNVNDRLKTWIWDQYQAGDDELLGMYGIQSPNKNNIDQNKKPTL